MIDPKLRDDPAVRDALEAEAARRDLLWFARRMHPTEANEAYIVSPAHRLLAGLLMAVEAGVVRRLIIQCQPRLGKSQLVSKMFPAWYLGRNPNRQYLATSYEESLALGFSRQARDYFYSKKWPFPGLGIDPHVRSAGEWKTTAGGIYYADGAGGALTGRGGHVVSIDDPIKGDVQGTSVLQMERLWEWYRKVARTRVMPKIGAVIITMTRWSHLDVVGRLLEQEKKGEGEGWVVLNLPALTDDPDGYYAEITVPDRMAAVCGIREGDAALEVSAKLVAARDRAEEIYRPPVVELDWPGKATGDNY